MAFHAIKAGEGDQYIAAGVECVSRGAGMTLPAMNPRLDGVKRHRLQRLHPDGADGRERGRALQGQPRGPGRVGGAVPAAGGRGARQRPLRQRDRGRGHSRDPRRRRRRHRRAHGHPRRRAARGHDGGGACEAQARLQARRQRDRRQRVPAQRRRRRRPGDVGGEGPRARPQAPGADRGVRGGGGPPRDHGPRRRSRRSRRCSSRPA